MAIRNSSNNNSRASLSDLSRARRRAYRASRRVTRIFIRAAEAADALRLKSRQVVFVTRRISPKK